MITRELARERRDAGLVWHPAAADRFQLDLTDEVELEVEAGFFVVSDLTIEARSTPTGTLLAFNGTTELALDSVTLDDALWIPHEAQLRTLLGGAFRMLRREHDGFVGELKILGEELAFAHPDPSEAYGRGLLALLRRAQ